VTSSVNTLKTCFKCGVTKDIESFYQHSMMADGRLGKCVECTRDDVNRNRMSRIDYYREYDKERGARPPLPGRQKARNAARVLARQPCSVCGAMKVEAHHTDYSKPLEVVWLCKKHHAEAHRKYG
jgi:hypothetical protein